MARTKSKELESLSNSLLNILKNSTEIVGTDFKLDSAVGITYRNANNELIRIRPSKITGPRNAKSNVTDEDLD